MGDSPKKPKSRDPYQLQADRNLQDRYTSEYNMRINSGPQTNIFGTKSTNFNTETMIDPNTGEEVTINVPTTSMNYNTDTQQFIDSLWGNLNQGDTEQTVLNKYDQLYSPLLDRRRQNLEAQRARQGINMGSDAFADLENQIYRGEGDIMNKWVLDAWGKGQQQRQQDFNMLQGINTGSQVFGASPGAIGLINPSDFQTASDASQSDKWKRYEEERRDNPTWWDIAGQVGGLGAQAGMMYATGGFGVPFWKQNQGIQQSDITPLAYNVHGPH